MQKELMDYIAHCLSQGFKPEQIKQALLTAGYAEADIKEALAGIQQPKKHTIGSFLLLVVLIALLVLLFYLGFSYFTSTPTTKQAPVIQQPPQATVGCTEKTPGQWCYTVNTEGAKSEGCFDAKDTCMSSYYADLAVAKKDETLCNNVAADGRDLCLSTVAAKKNDLAVCNAVADPAAKSDCIGTIGGQQNNKALCDSAPSKDECYLNYAMTSKDASICDLISTPEKKQQCEFFAVPPPPVPGTDAPAAT